MTSIADELLPDIQNAHKKTQVEIRINALNRLNNYLINCDDFKTQEPNLVYNILPNLLKRLDDKPNVIDSANEVVNTIISNISIQSLPNIQYI